MSNFSFVQEPSSTTANFNLLSNVLRKGKAAGTAVSKGGKATGKGGGFWEKAGPIMEAAGLATLPLSIAPMFVKSADTRALEQIRDEDRIRSTKKLGALPMTDSIRTKITELR
jgi:hypothetical protein